MSDTREQQIDVGGGEVPVTTEDLKLYETGTAKPSPDPSPQGANPGSSSAADVDAKPDQQPRQDDQEGEDERLSQSRIRRERQRQARERNAAELNMLRQEVARLGEIVARSQVGQVDTAVSALDSQFSQVRDRFQRAERLYAKAIDEGNGAAATQALAERDAALEEARRIEGQRQQAAIVRQRMTQPQPQAQPRQQPVPQPQVDPDVAEHGMNFMQEHTWYDLRGEDPDSVIVSTIDAQIAAEGYDPRDKAYWDELRSRAAKRLPHRFRTTASNNGGRRGPPVNGPGSAAGGQSAAANPLTPARIEAMKQAGVWDDPTARERMIARYRQYDAQQGAN